MVGAVCDPPVEDRDVTLPSECTDLFVDDTDPCVACLQQNCCDELKGCVATNNDTGNVDDPCWIGGEQADE